MRPVPPQAEAIVREFEGCRLKAYPDGHDKNGKPIYAIGYGRNTLGPNEPKPHEGMEITQEEADQWLHEDLQVIANQVDSAARTDKWDDLTDNQFSALISHVYNRGFGKFRRSSVFWALHEGRIHDVPGAMREYVSAEGRILPGLVRRREAEANLFTKSVEDAR